ncbi:MAG TPA: hypothetical protein VE959_13125 [Bryobacteraceae bacterium]|nr:hypothetical protein [Bryobacteraceae bacterium]
MADVISEYKKWKAQGENLRGEARQAMESRFRELLSEAVSIAEEYRADFGAPLKPPAPVTAFRYKTSGKPKAKKGQKQPPVKAVEASRPVPKPSKPDPKIARLQQRLATAKKKLEDARTAGEPARLLEDRVYEIEDALRLAGQPA